jgi:hypothetical protein
MEDYNAIFTGMGATSWIVSIALLILVIAGTWKMYEKAGRLGWTAIIPIWSQITQLQVAGMSPWWVLFYLVGIIPIVGSIAVVVFMVFVWLKIAKAFGKGVGFTLGLIFLPFIFVPILGFGDAVYQKPLAEQNNI